MLRLSLYQSHRALSFLSQVAARRISGAQYNLSDIQTHGRTHILANLWDLAASKTPTQSSQDTSTTLPHRHALLQSSSSAAIASCAYPTRTAARRIKGSRVVFLGGHERLATTGFSEVSDWQVGLWETGGLGGLRTIVLDQSARAGGRGVMPFWSDDNILCLAGKGPIRSNPTSSLRALLRTGSHRRRVLRGQGRAAGAWSLEDGETQTSAPTRTYTAPAPELMSARQTIVDSFSAPSLASYSSPAPPVPTPVLYASPPPVQSPAQAQYSALVKENARPNAELRDKYAKIRTLELELEGVRNG
ncbi:Coronin [Mycena sanguinolenta]|uniref:Coronin n=1 Tax=Mycena sanguinolenta TaxID=230812 RepID=A0A8H7DD97_9AGAR|nr:Coronin [Mycena sanguinolenta]